MHDAIAIKLRVIDGEWPAFDLRRWGGTPPARVESVLREALAAKARDEDWRAVVDARCQR